MALDADIYRKLNALVAQANKKRPTDRPTEWAVASVAMWAMLWRVSELEALSQLNKIGRMIDGGNWIIHIGGRDKLDAMLREDDDTNHVWRRNGQYVSFAEEAACWCQPFIDESLFIIEDDGTRHGLVFHRPFAGYVFRSRGEHGPWIVEQHDG